MIGQYLPQTNENATVVKSKKISHLNKAIIRRKLIAPPCFYNILMAAVSLATSRKKNTWMAG